MWHEVLADLRWLRLLAIVSREDSESVYMEDGRWLAVLIQMAMVRASSSGVYEERQPISWMSRIRRVIIGRCLYCEEESMTTTLAWASHLVSWGLKMDSMVEVPV
jgi:hypothetical protein